MRPTYEQLSTTAAKEAQQIALGLALVQTTSAKTKTSGKNATQPRKQASKKGPLIVKARDFNSRPPTAIEKAARKRRRARLLTAAQRATGATGGTGGTATEATATPTVNGTVTANVTATATHYAGVQKPQTKRQRRVDSAQYVEAHRREIGRLGASGLDKKSRKAYETEELVKLGCRRPKNQKMPIGHLQEKRKKEKERKEQEKQKMLDFGMLVRSRRR